MQKADKPSAGWRKLVGEPTAAPAFIELPVSKVRRTYPIGQIKPAKTTPSGIPDHSIDCDEFLALADRVREVRAAGAHVRVTIRDRLAATAHGLETPTEQVARLAAQCETIKDRLSTARVRKHEADRELVAVRARLAVTQRRRASVVKSTRTTRAKARAKKKAEAKKPDDVAGNRLAAFATGVEQGCKAAGCTLEGLAAGLGCTAEALHVRLVDMITGPLTQPKTPKSGSRKKKAAVKPRPRRK